MKQMIMNRLAVICVATVALALPLVLVGCGHEVSHTESSSVSSDGTVKAKEKTVTQASDGHVDQDRRVQNHLSQQALSEYEDHHCSALLQWQDNTATQNTA